MAKRSPKTESVFRTIKERIDRGEYRERPFPSERKLALQLGVSHATARKAVKEAVVAGLLARSDTSRIIVAEDRREVLQFALICPAEFSPWLMDWTKALRLVSERHGALLRVFHYVDGHDSLLTDALVADYDLYFLVAPEPMNRVVTDLVRDRKGRIATIFSDLTHLGVPCIDNSDHVGIDLLMDHLTGLGHRRIAFVNFEVAEQSGRIERYRSYCAKHRLTPIEASETDPTDWIPPLRAYRFLTREFTKPSLDVTAFIFSTVDPCLGALRACHEAKRMPGKDISICGFGPSVRARLMIPSVTSLQVPTHATVLTNAVDALLTGGEPMPTDGWRPTLYLGETTGKAPTGKS